LFVFLYAVAPSVSAETEPPRLDREALFGKSFRFSWTDGDHEGFNGIATLRMDGTIEGIPSPNETTWLVDEKGRLIFRHRNGTVSTIFNKAEQKGGLYRFEGAFQFADGVTHLLEEIDVASTFEKETELLHRLVRKYSTQQIVCLDIDETYSFRMKDGSARVIRLISAREIRDIVIGLVRRADVQVEIDGRRIRLVCAPYVMPSEIGGLRIQADTTAAWSPIRKRVQFSLWDAADPIVNTDSFRFPIRDYRLFSHGMQAYNEAVHLGLGDGDPGGQKFCHGYGFDLAGYEGQETITSVTDGEIAQIHRINGRPWSVVIRDTDGFAWDYGHLDSILPVVRKGNQIQQGQAIGMLGKTGPSGNFAHLHLGTYLSEYDLQKGRSNRRLNLYPWLVASYQKQYGKNLFAVARPHHTVVTGQTLVFDGSHSIASNARIISYRWTLPDGSTVERDKATMAFDKPGVYQATLRVKDDVGREDIDFCKVKVFTRDAPQKSIPTIFMTHSPTQNIVVGQPVRFRFWLQARKAMPMQVDFGDGSVIEKYESYSEVSHEFRSSGIQIVTACATIEGMRITQHQKLVVQASRMLPAAGPAPPQTRKSNGGGR
jgi:murein DD-endopeptidase MepM/ murein hydrolase activator NlpD